MLYGAIMILIDRHIDTLDSTEALDGIISNKVRKTYRHEVSKL